MKQFDVAVVGLGPAGMTAAVELAGMGLSVAVFDENVRPGGQIYRQDPPEFKSTPGDAVALKDRDGRQLIARFNQAAEVLKVYQDTVIWGIFDGHRLTFNCDQGSDIVTFKKLVLCEGACERVVPFPGWTLPGVLTLGGLQRFILHQHLLPGQRMVLSGSGPLLLAVAAELLKAGAKGLTVCEASSFKGAAGLMRELSTQQGLLPEALSYLLALARWRTLIHRSRAVIAARGNGRVEEVDIARLDVNWKPVPGSRKTLPVDVVGLGFGFQPMARLCRMAGCALVFDTIQRAFRPVVDTFMRTSVTDVYAAGDSTGIGGAKMAAVDGRIVACHIAAELGRISASDLDRRFHPLYLEKLKIGRYIARLERMFTPRRGIYDMVTDDTVVCRCEEATAGDIRTAVRNKHFNLNAIKKRTRLGMGPCQGKTCETTAAELALRAGAPLPDLGSLNIRTPVSPVPMWSLARHSDIAYGAT
jgi:thioredoxin reductase